MEGAMNRRSNGRLWVGGLLSAVLVIGCGAEGDRTGYIVLPDMVESVAVDTFERDAFSPTGSALRQAPEGAVPFGVAFDGYGPGPEEAARSGRELTNPLTGTVAELTRGRHLYETFCQVCHGPAGDGDGPVIGAFPNPPSLLADHARSMPDGQLRHVISRGQGIMVSYASQVRPEDRWLLVLYLRKLQGVDGGTTEEGSK